LRQKAAIKPKPGNPPFVSVPVVIPSGTVDEVKREMNLATKMRKNHREKAELFWQGDFLFVSLCAFLWPSHQAAGRFSSIFLPPIFLPAFRV
jgi:hypothetical protein